ncbi:hypothetical protein ES703_69702 [subsurface metagenome]
MSMNDLDAIRKAFAAYEAAIKAAFDTKSRTIQTAWQAWAKATAEATATFKEAIGSDGADET